MSTFELPLFPLHTVLFPGGPLPLRIFEARYLDMISACMKHDSGFGVCLIRAGKEVGEAAETYETGTIARIEDWHQRHDGLLGVTVIGQQRFQIASVRVQPNQLSVAKARLVAEEPPQDVPVQHLPLVDLLRNLIERMGHHYTKIPTRYGDASWVGYRLAELLPIKLSQKQYFLQLEDPVLRLDRLQEVLTDLDFV